MSNILDTPLYDANDDLGHWLGGSKTIREFFAKCLMKFWEEEDGFNAKRPFGNSGWASNLTYSVALGRGVPAKGGGSLLDEDGYFNSMDPDQELAIQYEITDALVEWLTGTGPTLHLDLPDLPDEELAPVIQLHPDLEQQSPSQGLIRKVDPALVQAIQDLSQSVRALSDHFERPYQIEYPD